MTDKELRKLSRLELLELLLEASRKNKKLIEKIKKLTEENQTAKNIENLSAVTNQVEAVLKYANSLTDTLKAGNVTATGTALKIDSIPKSENPESKSQGISDREIYIKMMHFFAMNEDKLDVFPEDIENLIRERLAKILEKGHLN